MHAAAWIVPVVDAEQSTVRATHKSPDGSTDRGPIAATDLSSIAHTSGAADFGAIAAAGLDTVGHASRLANGCTESHAVLYAFDCSERLPHRSALARAELDALSAPPV